MGYFVRFTEYVKLYNVAGVSPCDGKSKIKQCLTLKFVASI